LRITPDTNVLVRALVRDDPVQTPLAQSALVSAELVVLTLPTLCELAWVLISTYRYSRAATLEAMQLLVDSDNVVVSQPATDVGLAMLAAGGDFADGVIAVDGAGRLATTFVSFDRRAVHLVARQGYRAELIA
jgi:predicted nucleic-acid-binding protein